VLADKHPRRAGVVEVDVREEQVADVAELEPALAQPLLQRRDAGGRPAVEERETVLGLQQIGADDTLAAEVEEVERFRH
jgi:hypothetical protein